MKSIKMKSRNGRAGICNTISSILHLFVSQWPCSTLSLILLLFSTHASAGDLADISADHLEYLSQSNTYIARGSVKIILEDASLSADEMRLDSNTNDAVVTGNVIYEDNESVIKAERIELNLKTKIGTIYDDYIFYKKSNFYLRSSEIRKTGKETFFLDDATVTTCDAEPPAWHISAKNISVRQHKYLSGRHGLLNIRNVPVLYTPYFYAPLIRERQTGLLFPSFGYSSDKGYYYKQGLFWAIEKNQDATLYLDYYGKKGFGKGLDYRYELARGAGGELWMYHVKDRDPSRSLAEIMAYHNQELPYDISGYFKAHAVNEYDYYETMGSTSSSRFGLSTWETTRFGIASEERLQKYLESNLHISKQYGYGRLYLLAQGRQSLEESSSEIPQSLPEIGFTLDTVSKGFFSFNMAASAINFWKEEGAEARRLDIYPNLYLSYGRLLNLTQKVGLRETAYFLTKPNEYENRLIYDLETRLTTRLFRKYSSFIHIIEPSLQYTYIPSIDQEKIPFFDSTDEILKTNSLTYALTNRMSGSGPNNIESRFRLSQSYTLLETDEPFSPLLAEATLSAGNLNLGINASYDIDDTILTDFIGSITLTGKKGFASIGKNLRQTTELDQYTVEAGIYRPIKIINWSVPADLRGKLWYDAENGRIQELNVSSTYKKQCWGISVAFKQRPEKYEIMFAVELTGLGSFSIAQLPKFQ